MFKKRKPVEIPITESEVRMERASQRLENARDRLNEATKMLEDFIKDFKNSQRGNNERDTVGG